MVPPEKKKKGWAGQEWGGKKKQNIKKLSKPKGQKKEGTIVLEGVKLRDQLLQKGRRGSVGTGEGGVRKRPGGLSQLQGGAAWKPLNGSRFTDEREPL